MGVKGTLKSRKHQNGDVSLGVQTDTDPHVKGIRLDV